MTEAQDSIIESLKETSAGLKNSFLGTGVSLRCMPNSLVVTQKYCSWKDEPCPEGADSLARGQGRKNDK